MQGLAKEPCQNNLDKSTGDGAMVRRTDINSYSDSYNKRVEIAYPAPCYRFRRTVTLANIGTSDVIPPPQEDSNVFIGEGFAGMSGYIDFRSGINEEVPAATVNVELWAKDDENNVWFLVDSQTGVGHRQELRFQDKVRWRKVFVKLSSPSGGAVAANLVLTGE